MKSVATFQPITRITEEFFPPNRMDVVELPSSENPHEQAQIFVEQVRTAKHMTCLIVPPGTYPAIRVRRNIFIRAATPGTVEIIGENGMPALSTDTSCVRMEGIHLRTANPDEFPTISIISGRIILEGCAVSGSISSQRPRIAVYLRGCLIHSNGIGLQLSANSDAQVETSAFVKCEKGIVADESSHLTVLHTRFQECGRGRLQTSGVAVFATKSSLFFSGCRFIKNEKAVELVECPKTEFIACVFDGNTSGSITATRGATLDLHSLQFFGKDPAGPEHLVLTGVEADMQFCSFKNQPFQSQDLDFFKRTPETIPLQGVERLRTRLQASGAVEAAKTGLEEIFRNALTALQKKEQGLPLPLQSFHCVFEGKPHLGQQKAAAVLASGLQDLGFLSINKVINVEMANLLSMPSLQDVARDAKGGVLMLHVSPLAKTREVHAVYNRMREILSDLLKLCGNSSLLILCGEREFVRPILRNSPEMEALSNQLVQFSPYSPAESARIFQELCDTHKIRLTPRAMEKILLLFYMLDDRKDTRFSNFEGINNLFRASEKQHRTHCEAERNYKLPMDEMDLKIPLEKNMEPFLSTQPAFASFCPRCQNEFPWQPEAQGRVVHCPFCEKEWELNWGIWKESSFLQRARKEIDHTPLEHPFEPASNRVL